MDSCCAICLESFGNSCEIATIPCGHVFHETCIKKWHSAHKECSQCRTKCKSEEILRIFISETENGLKDNNLCIKYEESILNLKKEISSLKADKLTCCATTLEEESKIKLANLALKAENLKLEEKNLTFKKKNVELKAENLKLEEKNQIFEKKNVELQTIQVRNCEAYEELQEENIKLSKKLQNLKFHERNTQQMLRNKIIEISSKSNDIKYNLDRQIAETKKAKREIIALEAKYATCVPSYQMPRRNYKRKPETTKQLESKPATNQSPPQKKKKQTVHELPAEESNTEVIESPVNTPTTLLTSICNSLPSSSITREILEKRSRWSRFQSQSSNASSHTSPHSNSRSRSRSHSSTSSHSNSHSRSRSHSSAFPLGYPSRSRSGSSASSRSGSESSASRSGSPSHSRSRSRSGSSASSQSGSESSASSSSSPLRSRSRPRLLSSASSQSSTHSNRSRSRSRSSSPIYHVYQNITRRSSFD